MATGSSGAPKSAHIDSPSSTKFKDIGWDYGTAEPRSRDLVKCKFCDEVTNGGITGLKQHLIGCSTTISDCCKCPSLARERLIEHVQEKIDAKEVMDLVRDFEVITGDDEMENVPGSIPYPKGPLDTYYKRGRIDKKRKRSAKEQQDHDDYRKDVLDHATQMLSRWMYDVGIALSVVNYESLRTAIEDAGKYGPGMKTPTYHELRVTCLKNEKEHTGKLVQENIEESKEHGCTLMVDCWTDRNGRVLLNMLMNTGKGSAFLDRADVASYSKTGTKMCDLLSKYIEQVGPENVVQVITDNAYASLEVAKMLEKSYPHIFWTPSATNCLDLIFEDIIGISRFKGTIESAFRIKAYIYNRQRMVNMMRRFTNNKEMVRLANGRFATGFWTLKWFQEEKGNLVRLFDSEEWHESKVSKEIEGRKIKQILHMSSFWKNTSDFLNIGGPLLSVLHMVDREHKPAMGYIFEAMNKAKEAIAKSFADDEDEYRNIFKIIDKRWNDQLHEPLQAAGYYLNPNLFYNSPDGDGDSGYGMQRKITEDLKTYRYAEGTLALPTAVRQRTKMLPDIWWINYGASARHLRKFAIRVLGRVCSSSRFEENWSLFEHIHRKKRNRLDQRHLNDLVYIKYNMALKRRHELCWKVDEWLTSEPENTTFDTRVVFDDEDDGLARVDVRGEEVAESGNNLRSANTSSSFVCPKLGMFADGDSSGEEEITPLWSIYTDDMDNVGVDDSEDDDSVDGDF